MLRGTEPWKTERRFDLVPSRMRLFLVNASTEEEVRDDHRGSVARGRQASEPKRDGTLSSRPIGSFTLENRTFSIEFRSE